MEAPTHRLVATNNKSPEPKTFIAPRTVLNTIFISVPSNVTVTVLDQSSSAKCPLQVESRRLQNIPARFRQALSLAECYRHERVLHYLSEESAGEKAEAAACAATASCDMPPLAALNASSPRATDNPPRARSHTTMASSINWRPAWVSARRLPARPFPPRLCTRPFCSRLFTPRLRVVASTPARAASSASVGSWLPPIPTSRLNCSAVIPKGRNQAL